MLIQVILQVILRRSAYYTSFFYIFLVSFCLASCVLSPISQVEPLEIPPLKYGKPTDRNGLSDKFKGKKRCVYMLHGIGDQRNKDLSALGGRLKRVINDRNYKFECPEQPLDAIPVRAKKIIDYIEANERRSPHDYFFIIGYSLGGLVATDVATQLSVKKNPLAEKLAGVLTINSPMGGITEDALIERVAGGMMKHLQEGRADLIENSKYLQGLKQRVKSAKFPILSIASKLTLSEVGWSFLGFANNNNIGGDQTANVREIFPNSDCLVYLPSQVAVKDWRPSHRNIAVKAYQGYLHGDLSTALSMEQLQLLRKLVEEKPSTSILNKPDMLTMLANFVDNPEAAVAQCGIADEPEVIMENQ
ncbi:MAG: hypothetical protein K2X94_01975 [Amoebophilaceae bacterium]|nr:hypothetical protein [Amoebophilaceae bacterium]